MRRYVRLSELLVGVEGLALLRRMYDGSDDRAAARLAEVRRLLDDDALDAGEPIREASAPDGYEEWASSYDEPGNPIIALEQPAVWSLIEELAPGRALDAACGTGRHTRHLVDLGHEVVGADLTPAMLERAAASVPEASFVEADLRALPVADSDFDLVVCGLALGHLADLSTVVRELGRVMKPGARLIASVLHPFQVHLGWHARFSAHGARRFVREYPHSHGDHIAALGSAGLTVRRCLEADLGADQLRAQRRVYERIPEATLQAYVGLPAVLVWDAVKA